jgi:hypothetical protein
MMNEMKLWQEPTVYSSKTNEVKQGRLYYVQKYKRGEKTYRVKINTDSMSFKEFDNYVKALSETNLSAKDKRKFRQDYVKQTTDLEVQRIRRNNERVLKNLSVKDEDLPKLPKTDYKLNKEITRRKLKVLNGNENDSEYEGKEQRIILRLGNKATLSELGEDEFRKKLEKYMGDNGSSRNGQKFLDDIVAKWGIEYKNEE